MWKPRFSSGMDLRVVKTSICMLSAEPYMTLNTVKNSAGEVLGNVTRYRGSVGVAPASFSGTKVRWLTVQPVERTDLTSARKWAGLDQSKSAK